MNLSVYSENILGLVDTNTHMRRTHSNLLESVNALLICFENYIVPRCFGLQCRIRMFQCEIFIMHSRQLFVLVYSILTFIPDANLIDKISSSHLPFLLLLVKLARNDRGTFFFFSSNTDKLTKKTHGTRSSTSHN